MDTSSSFDSLTGTATALNVSNSTTHIVIKKHLIIHVCVIVTAFQFQCIVVVMGILFAHKV